MQRHFTKFQKRLYRCKTEEEREACIKQHQESWKEQRLHAYSKDVWVKYKRMVLAPRTKETEQEYSAERSTALRHAIKGLVFELALKEKPLMVPVFKLKAKRLIKEEFPEYAARLLV